MNDLNRYPIENSGKIIDKETVVSATIDSVWERWTTKEGTEKFFSKNTNVELKLGGPFEIHFMLEAPEGQKGSEGCRILSYLPKKMLSFEWNAPPSFGDIRGQHTQVIIFFEKLTDDTVKINLYHHGFGVSEKWDELFDYFNSAWDLVLGWFEKSFEE